MLKYRYNLLEKAPFPEKKAPFPEDRTMMVGGSGHMQNGEPPTVSHKATSRIDDALSRAHAEPRQTTRRRFTAEYKLKILRAADQCTRPGQLAKLLKREELYSSHLTAWRRQREVGILAALAPRKRGRKPARHDPLTDENRALRRENEHLQARLAQAETIIQMQTHVSRLLGIPQQALESTEGDQERIAQPAGTVPTADLGPTLGQTPECALS
ncbi:MAG: hypothetical protein A2V70_20145 [Planctomycetes bacterium RBG_13_63_9]|nr:MAG: hypothetical protein A2V70_20145 [Planctomycetes bacterium RBG_13_63_9]